jgi:L-threonylcarbamoyladenylate synthase
MATPIIPEQQWRDCLPLFAGGGIVAIPTDTVYGIAALPDNAAAIDRIYEAKGRPAEKALPILVSSAEAAARLAHFSPLAWRLCLAFWPGALTLVVQADADFRSLALSADGTIGLRMPASDLALQILAGAGGVLAVTSANLSGLPAARSPAEALDQLQGRIDAIVDGGVCAGGVASTVVRALGDAPEILREGAIPAEKIAHASDKPSGGAPREW